MTAMTQEEIVSNTKTVIQALEALKNENRSILSGLMSSLTAIKAEADASDPNVKLREEKASIIQKCVESIELGLGEAQVRVSGHIYSAKPNVFRALLLHILRFLPQCCFLHCFSIIAFAYSCLF